MKKLLMLLLLAGCSAPSPMVVEFGETYRVTKGFYKGCVGEAHGVTDNGEKVLFSPLICKNWRISPQWVETEYLEHQNVTIQEK